MFCSLGVAANATFWSFLTAAADPCVAQLSNVIGFSCLLYSLSLALVYVRWSPVKRTQGIRTGGRLFCGHDIRHALMAITLIVHSTELAERIASRADGWLARLAPVVAFVSVIACQALYTALQEYRNGGSLLVVTLAFWTCGGICRTLLLLSAMGAGLRFSHVAYSMSAAGVLLYSGVAATDMVALFAERKRKIKRQTSSTSESIPSDRCGYRHPFAGWYSKITFCWLTSILHRGYYAVSLQPEHFGVLLRLERVSTHCQRLRNTVFPNTNEASGNHSIHLWRSLAKCYWKTFAFGGCLKLIGDVLSLIPPLGISVVVDYIEILQQNNSSTQNNHGSHITWSQFLQNGYIMAAVVLLMILGQGTLSQNSTHIINVAGIRLKNALQGLIYQKLLRIRKNYLKERNGCDNAAYVTNLITEDTYNIMSCFWIGNYIWAIPLKIIVLIYLLHRVIGISAVIGSITCILIMLIAQFVIGGKMTGNYKITSDWGDKRLRRINEILQGIRFIKLCGWENDFIDEVTEMRKNELNRLNLDSLYWTLITFLANTSSIIIAISSLTLHYYLLEKPITASSLFASLALFDQLTVPLFIFPVILPIIVSAAVSAKRIEKFLALPEISVSRDKSTISKEAPRTVDFQRESPGGSFEQQNKSENGVGIRLRKITENSETEEDNKARYDETTTNTPSLLRTTNMVASWNDATRLQLQVGNITIYRGTLNVIIGEKGSGKSSLLAALLEEMTRESGKIEWKRVTRLGYVPQMPWLLNDTLKRNVIFGSPFHEKRFWRVIRVCALKSDVNSMPHKENTMVGDRGMNLSGGQKQRVAIARMLYSEPDLLVMDNPFSSLDCKITNHIFENGIKKLLSKKNTTIVMTTNFDKYLAFADQIIVMENCHVKTTGSLKEIESIAAKEIRGLTESMFGNVTTSSEPETTNQNVVGFIPFGRRRSTLLGSRYFTHDLLLPIDDCEEGPVAIAPRQRRSRAATVTEYPHTPALHRNVFRVSSLQTNHHRQQRPEQPKLQCEPRIQPDSARNQSTVSANGDDEAIDEPNQSPEEYRWKVDICSDKSNLSWVTYRRYISNCGVLAVLLFLIFTFLWQIIRVLADFWLSYVISSTCNRVSEKQEVQLHLLFYILLSIFALVISLFSTAIGQYGAAVSRKHLHARMLSNILKCSMQFFDTTPFGQIINRFSTDTEIIDKKISASTQRLIQFQLLCISAILVNCLVTPWFIVIVIPIALVYYTVQRFYRCSSRKLQRLENILKIPVVDHFSETFAGLEVIRAFDKENSFIEALFEKIDRHTNVFLILNSTNRWLGITLDYLGGMIVSAAMLISIISITLKPDLQTSTFFGLAINYTLLIPIYLTWVVKFSNDLEMYMGAVDRVCSYADMPTEDYNMETTQPIHWPNKGTIQFENVTLRYNAQGRNIIQNINLRIDCCQKVGICGRTGSGKSTLIMSLLKMVPLAEGKIIFDAANIDLVPLPLLRSKISVVSQDVILFSGSIRQNLDLRKEFSDEVLWHSLELVRIRETIVSLGGLDAQVQDGGSNLSVGERQLICLARAILRNTSCLILDEATNALQPEAEVDFLNLVLDIFHHQTVIVITHRISSLLRFDRILVLNNGVIVEDGTPSDLLLDKNGQFYGLLKITQNEPSVRRKFLF